MRGRRLEKNRRRIRWNTLKIFSSRERRRCLQIVCRSRMALLGQTPREVPRPALLKNPARKGGVLYFTPLGSHVRYWYHVPGYLPRLARG